jgi:hypothetical protein
MRMAALTDGTVTLSIDPENVDDDASLGVVGAIEGAFECVATGSAGATCIQSGVGNMVRAAFYGLTKSSSTTPGVQQCQNDPTAVWLVTNNVTSSWSSSSNGSSVRTAPRPGMPGARRRRHR